MRQKDSRLNGLNPLSYIGANAYSPPNLTIDNRAPTANDTSNFHVGSIWINNNVTPQEAYILTSLDSGSATWQAMTLGTTLPLIVSEGGTGRITLNDHSVLVGAGTNPITQLTVGSNGQILVGSVGADPVFANIGSGTGIDVTEGAGTVSVDVAAIVPKSFIGDTGTAAAAANVLKISGGNNANSVASGSTVTIHATTAVDVASSYVCDAGSATPALNVINVVGAGGASTSGAGSTITVTAGAGVGASVCSFAAYQATDGGAPNNVVVALGEAVAMTELYDTGGNFTIGDGAGTAAVFTAPQDGKYLLQMQISFRDIATSMVFKAYIETTSETYIAQNNLTTTNSASFARNVTVIADMSSGETAQYKCFSADSNPNYLVQGDDTGGEHRTFVSGALLEAAVSTGSSICSFLAHQATDGGETKDTAGGVYLGDTVIMSEIYDIGGNFTPGDGAGTSAKFTAPVTGRYMLQAQIDVNHISGALAGIEASLKIETTSRTYLRRHKDLNLSGDSVTTEIGIPLTVIADMSIGDTAEFYVETSNGIIGDFEVAGDDAGEYRTFVSGSLI